MPIHLTVSGHLGKDPYEQMVGGKRVVVISIASRKPNSRHADWVTGSIYLPHLQTLALECLNKGDLVQVFGVLGKLGVYYTQGKARPSLDMFINAIGSVAKKEKERDAIV